MAFLRPLEYHAKRFHRKQANAWLAYLANLTVVLPWGRRTGKSDFYAEVLIEDVENYGKPCLYLASTQDSAREIMWPKLRERIQGYPDWKLNESKLEAIHVPSKAPVRLRGIERVDELAGKAYRIIICDEYALWRKKNRQVSDIIKLILAPMIADFDGLIMYGSSKRGGTISTSCTSALLSNPKKYHVEEATLFDNPFISEDGKKKTVAEYDGPEDPLYRQEIGNEYLTFQGMVFALDAAGYTERRWDPADLDHSYHVRGVDHGFSPDPTACVWIAYNFRKGHWLVYSEYEEQALLVHQHAEAIGGQEPYPIDETYSDIDPQLIAEYSDIGLEMSPAGKFDKQARLLRIVSALKNGRLKIAPNCTKLLKQMGAYEWGQDGNDHLIDALNYGFTNAMTPAAPQKPQVDDRFRPKRDEYGQNFG